MSAASRGNAAELLCSQQLEREGWVCGSRRHVGGAGDILAVKWLEWEKTREGVALMTWGRGYEVHLIEVKYGKSAWKNFTKQDRIDLYETARSIGAEAYLYHYPTGQATPEVYHWTAWPGWQNDVPDESEVAA